MWKGAGYLVSAKILEGALRRGQLEHKFVGFWIPCNILPKFLRGLCKGVSWNTNLLDSGFHAIYLYYIEDIIILEIMDYTQINIISSILCLKIFASPLQYQLVADLACYTLSTSHSPVVMYGQILLL